MAALTDNTPAAGAQALRSLEIEDRPGPISFAALCVRIADAHEAADILHLHLAEDMEANRIGAVVAGLMAATLGDVHRLMLLFGDVTVARE